MDNPSRSQRAANAHAASHGYGAARALATRLVAAWSAEDDLSLAVAILHEPERTQAYAESVEVPFRDYLAELEAIAAERGDASPVPANASRDDLYVAYVAGFDIGFRSALIEGCEHLTEVTALV